VASLGSTPGLIVAAGVGAAASVALEPAFEVPKQDAWSRLPNRILDAGTLASLVAQGGVVLGDPDGSTDGSAYDAARRQGFGSDKLDRLVWLALRAPPHSEAQDLRRRDKINHEQLLHSFAKDQIEPQYWDALADLVDDRLSPQNVAVAIVRGLMDNPGILPVGPPSAEGKIPKFPVSGIDPVAESQASGVNKDRLAVLAGIFGRPPGPQEAASATFRGIIEKVDYLRAIGEGDVRNEWAEAIFEAARQILTSGEYAEAQLRGFLTPDERRAQTARHGMSDADSDLLYNLSGRSIAEHQITTGEARGGVFEGPIDTIPKAYLQALQRGNLRPEYFNLAYANRYSYPSAFVLRSLATSGEITQDEAHQTLLEIGWPPALAAKVSASWAPAGEVAKLNPWVKAQQTRLVTAMHKASTKTGVPRTALEPYLEPLVPDLADRDAIFQLWDDERAVVALTGA
jgi:hypothetical protein